METIQDKMRRGNGPVYDIDSPTAYLESLIAGLQEECAAYHRVLAAMRDLVAARQAIINLHASEVERQRGNDES